MTKENSRVEVSVRPEQICENYECIMRVTFYPLHAGRRTLLKVSSRLSPEAGDLFLFKT